MMSEYYKFFGMVFTSYRLKKIQHIINLHLNFTKPIYPKKKKTLPNQTFESGTSWTCWTKDDYYTMKGYVNNL